MTDYEEEQRHEIEAIESIYPEEFEVIQTEPLHVFKIIVTPQCDEEEESEIHTSFKEADKKKRAEQVLVPNKKFSRLASCTVQFTYVSNYPDEAPLTEVVESTNLDDEQIQDLDTLMGETAQENLGMVMVFTIVSAVQEKLADIMEKTTLQRIEEAARVTREREEAEHKKFEGTRVTVENFLAWKAKFDAEMAELKKITLETEIANKKPTGKELFLRDASMNDSDVKFLQSEGDSVEVDESLFQDMDDLDLDDDLADEIED